MVQRQQSAAALILEHPECAPVLQRHHLDYGARGDETLEAAAVRCSVDVDALLAALDEAVATGRPSAVVDARGLSTSALLAHIVEAHHAWLRDELPALVSLGLKVSHVHGDHQPSLETLADELEALAEELSEHLDDTEASLFPALEGGGPDVAALAGRLDELRREHLELAAHLERIRKAADGYRVPGWACGSYRALFDALQRLEADLFSHQHLELHVLRPRFATA